MVAAQKRLEQVTIGSLEDLRSRLKDDLRAARSLVDAAQRFVEFLRQAFAEDVLLVRAYATLPMGDLPAADREFARRIARGTPYAAALSEETLVLALIGTAGERADWNDRERSERHLAVPLLSGEFVEDTPMVARLLRQLGVRLRWVTGGRDALTRSLIGGFNGLFFVPDARTERDERGRLVIPDQDFVREYGVKTVFGMGGAYVDGLLVSVILFSRRRVDREVAASLGTLISRFKMSTSPLVSEGAIFGPVATP